MSTALSKFTRLALLAPGLVLSAPQISPAHESPSEAVRSITELIRRFGESAELLEMRATELRTLNRPAEARADLERALELDTADIERTAVRTADLAAVLIDMNNFEEARGRIDALLSRTGLSADSRAMLLRRRADAHLGTGDRARAARDLKLVLEVRPDDIDLLLLRGQCLVMSGQAAEAAAELEAAATRTASAAVGILMIEALILAGNGAEALARIGPHLERARWKASWLLRRAACRRIEGRAEDAARDCRTALDELDSRIHPERPDPGLMLSRAEARLGANAGEDSDAAARQDLERAAALGVAEFDLWRVKRLADEKVARVAEADRRTAD